MPILRDYQNQIDVACTKMNPTVIFVKKLIRIGAPCENDRRTPKLCNLLVAGVVQISYQKSSDSKSKAK